MGKKSTTEDVATEAREGFDLRSRLRGVTKLTKEVTVYTDAVAGAELGGAENQEQSGIIIGRRRWGLRGDLDALVERMKFLKKQSPTDEDALVEVGKEIASIKKKLPAVVKRLEESALVFTLTTVPEFVVRDVKRKAKKAAGIKGKGIDGMEEEFGLEYVPTLLSASVLSWVDRASDETFSSLSIDEAKTLRDELPAGQFQKLDAAMIELIFQTQIGNQATDSVDFS